MEVLNITMSFLSVSNKTTDRKKPAYNERFGATAAVTLQKVMCEHERKQPAERALEAATAPSCHHVGKVERARWRKM